jgi:hypothetical protein
MFQKDQRPHGPRENGGAAAAAYIISYNGSQSLAAIGEFYLIGRRFHIRKSGGKRFAANDTLTPALSQRERGVLSQPLQREREF